MTRVLVTGATGMVGSHMVDMFVERYPDVQVYATKRWRSPVNNIEHVKDKIKLVDCDLLDASAVRDLLDMVRPDYIFHLAAQSYVLDSWKHPTVNLHQNPLMQLNIFEACRALKIDPVIQLALSSEEYGKVYAEELPIREDNPLRPLSPYAVSKVTQDMLGYQYFESYGIKAIRTRAFNHEGPRRGEVFVTSNFARQIIEIEFGLREPVIYVGNLDSKRDWTDVRDMVRAYYLAVQHCQPGEVYVIASGVARTIREMLDFLLAQSSVQVEVKVDPDRLRPSDVLYLQGDPTKFKKATGWEPQISFEQTMTDIMAYWRKEVQKQILVRPENLAKAAGVSMDFSPPGLSFAAGKPQPVIRAK